MNRARLSVGPIACCLLDATLTLAGQPEAYWSGDRLMAMEANPLARVLLHLDPFAFVAGVAAALVLYTALLSLLPDNLARVLAFVIVFAHTIAAGSWLLHWGAMGYLSAVLLLVVASRVLAYGWQSDSRSTA